MRLAVVGDGTVDGYARYELSADGDNATMAAPSVGQVHSNNSFVRPHTFGIWCGFDGVKQPHIRNVIYVNLRFENNDEGFPVELDCEYRGGEQ